MTGPTRASDPDGLDTDIRRSLREATGERQAETLRAIDNRLLILFAIVVGALITYSWVDERSDRDFRRQIVQVCQNNNAGHVRVNEALERLAMTAASNPNRTPEQQERVAATYRDLQLPIAECPPV